MNVHTSQLLSRVVQATSSQKPADMAPEAEGTREGAATTRQSDRDKIKVAQQFEAIFVRQLLQQMQPAPSGDGAGGSPGGELYQGIGQEALAEHISTRSEGFGIAHSLLKHWGVKSATHQEG